MGEDEENILKFADLVNYTLNTSVLHNKLELKWNDSSILDEGGFTLTYINDLD